MSDMKDTNGTTDTSDTNDTNNPSKQERGPHQGQPVLRAGAPLDKATAAMIIRRQGAMCCVPAAFIALLLNAILPQSRRHAW